MVSACRSEISARQKWCSQKFFWSIYVSTVVSFMRMQKPTVCSVHSLGAILRFLLIPKEELMKPSTFSHLCLAGRLLCWQIGWALFSCRSHLLVRQQLHTIPAGDSWHQGNPCGMRRLQQVSTTAAVLLNMLNRYFCFFFHIDLWILIETQDQISVCVVRVHCQGTAI